jgi:hypothetical protein
MDSSPRGTRAFAAFADEAAAVPGDLMDSTCVEEVAALLDAYVRILREGVLTVLAETRWDD